MSTRNRSKRNCGFTVIARPLNDLPPSESEAAPLINLIRNFQSLAAPELINDEETSGTHIVDEIDSSSSSVSGLPFSESQQPLPQLSVLPSQLQSEKKKKKKKSHKKKSQSTEGPSFEGSEEQQQFLAHAALRTQWHASQVLNSPEGPQAIMTIIKMTQEVVPSPQPSYSQVATRSQSSDSQVVPSIRSSNLQIYPKSQSPDHQVDVNTQPSSPRAHPLTSQGLVSITPGITLSEVTNYNSNSGFGFLGDIRSTIFALFSKNDGLTLSLEARKRHINYKIYDKDRFLNYVLGKEAIPEEIMVWKNTYFFIIHNISPKSTVHFLVLPRIPIDELHDLRSLRDIALVNGLKACSYQMILACKKLYPYLNFYMGFHRLHSMRQLHMHVISDDFCSDEKLSGRVYNNYGTSLFISPEEVIQFIEEKKSLRLSREDKDSLWLIRNGKLHCNQCVNEYWQVEIYTFKEHLWSHLRDRIDEYNQQCVEPSNNAKSKKLLLATPFHCLRDSADVMTPSIAVSDRS